MKSTYQTNPRLPRLAAALITIVGMPFAAHAATYTWTGANGADFGVASNWSGSVIPGSADIAQIGAPASSSTTVVISAADTINIGTLLLNHTNNTQGRTIVNQTGGTVTTGSLAGGVTGGSKVWTYNLSGGTLNVTNSIFFGTGGHANTTDTRGSGINVAGGILNYTSASGISLGYVGMSDSYITVSSGAFNANSAAYINLGDNGMNTYDNSTGSIAVNGSGVFSATSGTLNVGFYYPYNTSSNSALTDNKAMGVVSIADNGLMKVKSVVIGVQGYAYGELLLTGGTLQTASVALGASLVASTSTTNFVSANGGTIQATTDGASLIGAGLYTTIGTNGLTVDTNGKSVSIDTQLRGTGGLIKSGAGALTLNAVNSYSGNTTVSSGTLNVKGALSSGTVAVNGAVLGGNGTINGPVQIAAGALSGSNLTISGSTTFSGVSTLSGSNNLASVAISSGITTVSGSTSASGGISVASTSTLANNGVLKGDASVFGTLKGHGTIDGALTIKDGGQIVTSDTPGFQTVTGDLVLESAAKISMTLDSLASYDQLNVQGLITLNGTLELNLASGLDVGTYTLINNLGSSVLGGVNVFSDVQLISGASTWDLGFGTSHETASYSYKLNYAGGDSNDLILTVTAVPEPATWAMLTGGLGLLAICQRRKLRA